jgi:hypothetical protein
VAPSVSADAVQQPPRRIGSRAGAPLYRKQILSPVYTIDRIYTSMMGPKSAHAFHLSGKALTPEPELLWVTGFEAAMAAPDGVNPMSQEFMCHSNLNVDAVAYHALLPTRLVVTGGRLFTLAQGQISATLPEGFGIPIPSQQPLQLFAQVLNHNIEGQTLQVRHRVRVDFVRDRDLQQPLVPLVHHGVFGMKLVEGPDGHFRVPHDRVGAAEFGEGCGIGEPAEAGEAHLIGDGYDRVFTAFWLVQPGREVNHTRVTDFLALPYDTTAHYITAHLHPFAESLELRDLTSGETVYKSSTRQADSGIGLAEVEHFSSAEGLPLYKDHQYELVSVYDNTSGEVQDAMATLMLYLRVKDFSVADDVHAPVAASAGT